MALECGVTVDVASAVKDYMLESIMMGVHMKEVEKFITPYSGKHCLFTCYHNFLVDRRDPDLRVDEEFIKEDEEPVAAKTDYHVPASQKINTVTAKPAEIESPTKSHK